MVNIGPASHRMSSLQLSSKYGPRTKGDKNLSCPLSASSASVLMPHVQTPPEGRFVNQAGFKGPHNFKRIKQ